MNGPSVTPLARTVLAVAGGWSWWPPSTSLPEPPPPFSYQAPISAYHAWPSASVRFLAASVSISKMTYFTVASIRRGATVASLHQFHERGDRVSDIRFPFRSRPLASAWTPAPPVTASASFESRVKMAS